jgi:hypothetical protein
MTFRWKSAKKRFLSARAAHREFLAAGGVGLHVEGSVDEGSLSAELRLPDRKAADRFVTLMRPFLSERSDYAYGHLWQRLQEEMHITTEEKAAIDTHIAAAERGSLPLAVDGEMLTAKTLHGLVAQGQFFAQDSAAIAKTTKLCEMPLMRHVLWFQFYSFPLDVLRVVARLDHVRSRTTSTAPGSVVGKCIFCLREDGPFTSEEHIIAEAFGNDELVLPPGIVCDPCNHGQISKLDQALVEFAPLAALRTLYVPFTKSGKLPRAEFSNATWTKTRPNHIEFRLNAAPVKQPLPDGTTRMSFTVEGMRPVQPHLIARAIYKIALELVALDYGVEQAFESRYDQARRFVLGKSPTFPNAFMFMTEATPRPEVHTHLTRAHGGTSLALDIFGFKAIVNLEPEPRVGNAGLPPGAPVQLFALDQPPPSDL